MRDKRNLNGGMTTGHAGVLSRFFFISAFLGLLIGLFEASRLWTTPRVIPLLVPDVGWVIWFLAPLVDMAFFGVVGLGLGLLGGRTRHKEVPIAFEAAVTVTFVTFMVAWFHREIGLRPFNFHMEVTTPLTVFTSVFVASLVILAVSWHRLAGFLDVWVGRLLKPLAWGLATSAVVTFAGIGIFIVRPSFSGNPVEAAPPSSGAPNIVFITLDTARADHFSSYGYSRPTTPNIDRFAKTGVLFENAIAPSSWTLASHASMFTGLLPQQHGADWATPLPSGPWTLAEILRSKGYQTAGVVANFLYLQKGWGIAQGFENYDDYRTSVLRNLSQTFFGDAFVQPIYQILGPYDWMYRRDAGEINREVFEWFRHRSSRPFFLFINYFDVHDPYVTAAPYSGRFGMAPKRIIRKLRFVAENRASSSVITPQERGLLEDSYDDCLAYLDSRVGDLFRFLRQSSQWRNTLVIITSDHGEQFGGHGDYIHGFNLYRGLLHVPLIIAGPGVPHDVRISHLVGTRQLFSTVLDLAGGGKSPFSRTSLARFWSPDFKSSPFDDDVVSELVPDFGGDWQHIMISLTTPRYQYIQDRSGREELYNWVTDSAEKDNLATSSAEQATRQKLLNRLASLVSGATGPWRGPQYLQALDTVAGPARLVLLRPQPPREGDASNQFRIGAAQDFFKSEQSTPAKPTQSERELMQSLPYQ